MKRKKRSGTETFVYHLNQIVIIHKRKDSCRWCSNVITKEDGTINERKTWHEDCATEYLLIYSSGEQRAQLWNRDKGVCNHCGKFSMSWQADHIKPLVEQKV